MDGKEPMEIKQACEEYLEYILTTKSVATWQYYKYQMKPILDYFNSRTIFEFDCLTENEFNSFIRYFRSRSKNITVNKKVMFLKNVLRHFQINLSHVLNFKKLRQVITHFDIFTEDELRSIMKYVKHLNESNPYDLTRKVVLLLLLDTCARRNEILNIEIKNIDFDNKEILLTNTKTKVDRFVYFSKLSYDALKKYVAFYPERQYLLFNYRVFERFTARNMRSLFEHMKKHLGIKRIHAHMFRHSMATLLIERDVDVYVLKEILGHSSIMTTQIYIHMNRNKIRSEHQRAAYLTDK